MKKFVSLSLLILLATMLGAIQATLGDRVFALAAFFAGLWFVISMVLLARPPGMPEFVNDAGSADEQFVRRKDVIPVLPVRERVRLSLGIACGSCFAVWVTLVFFAG